MDKELPLYKITIEEEYSEGENLGIDMIAFTSKPAVMVKGMAFNSAQIFHFKDEPKMRIVAPAMIPMNIYRNDEGEEYYVQFTEQEIENIYSKFMQDLNNQNLFNLEHTDKKVPAYILEAWIVENPKEDKAYSSYGIEVPKGTLMLTAQITDKEYYNKLVESDQVGFSIEGFLGLKLSNQINKYNMKLPDGEHLIEGKIYVVKDGEVIEIKEEVPAEMEAELAAEEVVEEEEIEAEEVAAAEVKEEVKEEIAMAVDVETDSEAVLAIVQPVLDAMATELMKAIAEVKALIPVQEEVETEEVELSEQKFTAIDRLKKYRQLFKEN
jgi:rRNA maturation endonuclease Nob1